LERSLKEKLQCRAKAHGRTVEEEIREILRSEVAEDDFPSYGLGTEITALFSKTGLETGIPELRGHFVTFVFDGRREENK